jgi:radical SAM enzyme (TIGR01210 family)
MTSISLRSAEEAQLRRSLTELAARLRTSGTEKPPVPRFLSYDMLRGSDGRTVGRKKVIVMSGGCSVPTCTMCPFTNENNFGLPRDPASLLEQVDHALDRRSDEPDYEVLALYNDGSFFAPTEVALPVQVAIAEKVAAADVRRLVVESLPLFIRRSVLEPFVEALGSVDLEIGIGLQSANDLVRETLVNTRVTRSGFERALITMADLGVHPKIYLMIKPPFLTDEEAITDVAESVEYLHALGVDSVTMCPTRVSANTVAWWLLERGRYEPPNLWTVVDAVRRAHEMASVRVACINLRGADFQSVFPDSCPLCADMIVDGLLRYSESGDIAALPHECVCKPDLTPAPLETRKIVSRALSAIGPCGQGGDLP